MVNETDGVSWLGPSTISAFDGTERLAATDVGVLDSWQCAFWDVLEDGAERAMIIRSPPLSSPRPRQPGHHSPLPPIPLFPLTRWS